MRGAFALLGIGMMLLFGCSEAGGEKNETGCVCADEYKPVCGNDNITYGNACMAACANVSVGVQGECVSCEDTDGGKDPAVKGTASSAGLSFADTCNGFYSVDEYFCSGKNVDKETMKCKDGEECVGGACGPAIPKPAVECNDTDGGKDTAYSGSVKSGAALYQDVCQDGKNVKEFYCKLDGSAGEEIIPCKTGYGCDGGKCVKSGQTCTDTDGGRNTGLEGMVEIKTGLVLTQHLDKCLSDTRLREYYCFNNEQIMEDIDCPAGSRCVTAACKEDQCMDSDGGYMIFSKGAVNKGSALYDDRCDTLTSGTEYYCDQNQVKSATFVCKSGYVCHGGRCEAG